MPILYLSAQRDVFQPEYQHLVVPVAIHSFDGIFNEDVARAALAIAFGRPNGGYVIDRNGEGFDISEKGVATKIAIWVIDDDTCGGVGEAEAYESDPRSDS